jgi:hypothetical protein
MFIFCFIIILLGYIVYYEYLYRIILVSSNKLFDESKDDDKKIDADSIKNDIVNEINYQKQMEQNTKLKLYNEQKEKIRNEVLLKIREKIKKQIEMDEEIKKYKKYYDISKEKLNKDLQTNEADELATWFKNK